jgi:prepilin-type N-terminal cleavage/methylation domain-containing protein
MTARGTQRVTSARARLHAATRARSRERGFTLTELMVVVAIVAVLAALIIAVNSRQYGGNANVLAEQVVGTFSQARTRALMTRRIHRVEVHFELNPVELRVFQATVPGMTRTNINNATFVERVRIPRSVLLWAALPGAQTSAQNPGQSTAQFNIDFLPDGSLVQAATLYFKDSGGANPRLSKVLVYQATGSSYARTSW